MPAIRVDFNSLRQVAESIKTYCSYQDDRMRQADFDIKTMLASDWLGTDALEFSRKWEGASSGDSEAAKFKNSLLDFGELLAVCASEYRRAQIGAQNEAAALRASLASD